MKRLGKIKTLAAAAVAAIALTTGLAVAQTGTQDSQAKPHAGKHGFGKGRGHRGGGMHGFGRLNLTDEQKARMQQIHQSFGERTKGLREQLRAKRQELRQAESGGVFNEALATQKLTEAAVIEAKLMGERFRVHQEMLSVLTPEQKTQMEQQREQRKSRRGEGRGRRGKQQTPQMQ
ncbi:MAG TPA: Spy/CpxP family protein refolding chaperone [Pyrinomonadaceae bacterium]|nr:Spy/CpxP family protein refolding chaperone [Pyrinomonadaceae bacterium]